MPTARRRRPGVAMNLLFSYVEHAELTRAMTEIVQEELDHFHQVRAILDRRGIRFYKLPPSQLRRRSCTSWSASTSRSGPSIGCWSPA